MAVEGPRKGEPSTKIMRYGLRTQPAPLVRGSSRRIMSLRFRPAYISVIDRRASPEAVIGPAVPNPLLAHQRDHVPATPPVAGVSGATTVLAVRPSGSLVGDGGAPKHLALCCDSRNVKGSLRRAKKRRALDSCAPFWPSGYRDGRLRRKHEAILWEKPKNQNRKTSA